MPYIGNEVGNRFVASKAASVYSGNGSTTAFTLEHAVGSDEDILVSVDGVIQEPSVAYAVSSGTTLTFTAAPSSNSGNNIFVYYLFRTVATVDHPSTSSLQATDGTFSSTLNVTGETTLATHLNLGDNDKIKLGASADLQIYHDGSHSYVQDNGTGNIRIKGANIEIVDNDDGGSLLQAVEGGAVTLYHNNSAKLDTTSSGVTVTTAMAAINTGGDAHVQIKGNTRDFKIEQNNYGLRFYDTDASSERLRIDASGAMTLPLQPAFLAQIASAQTIPINATTTLNIATEIFDQNADYNNSTYTFTAPVTGKYQLQVNILTRFGDTASDYYDFRITTSNRAYYNTVDPNVFDEDQQYFTYIITALADMDANDTALVNVGINNSGSAQLSCDTGTYFSGYLVA